MKKTKWRLLEFDSPLIGKYYKIQKRLFGNVWWSMELSDECDIIFGREKAEKWFRHFTEGYTQTIIKEL